MRSYSLLVVLLTGCEGPALSPPPVPLVPSLHGVLVVTGSDHGSPAVIERIGESSASDPDCVGDAYGGIALSADVAPDPGDETILVSYTEGVVVLGADGHRIASTPGFDCTGSQDDLIAMEIVRTSFEAPVIAVAATKGGRRESSTWLELLAVGPTAHLDRLFVGEIERHDDQGIHAGDVTFAPEGLVYRHPIDGVSMWKFDRRVRRYVVWRSLGHVNPETRSAPTVD